MNTPEPGVEHPITILGSRNRDFTATTVNDPSSTSSFTRDRLRPP